MKKLLLMIFVFLFGDSTAFASIVRASRPLAMNFSKIGASHSGMSLYEAQKPFEIQPKAQQFRYNSTSIQSDQSEYAYQPQVYYDAKNFSDDSGYSDQKRQKKKQYSSSDSEELNSDFESFLKGTAFLGVISNGIMNFEYEEDLETPVDVGSLLIKERDTHISSYTHLTEFLKKYRVSQSVEKFIKTRGSALAEPLKEKPKFGLISEQVEGQSVKLYMKGSQVDRIINGERMRRYLEIEGLDNKFLVVDERLCAFGEERLKIISPAVSSHQQFKKISLVELKSLIKIMFETGYIDWKIGNNLIRNQNDQLVFVDMEDQSFNNWFVYNQKEALLWMLQKELGDNGSMCDDQAQAWIVQQINILENKQGWITYLLNFTKFKISDFWQGVDLEDKKLERLNKISQYDTDIDFEQVKAEFSLLYKQQEDYKKQESKFDKYQMFQQRQLYLNNQ